MLAAPATSAGVSGRQNAMVTPRPAFSRSIVKPHASAAYFGTVLPARTLPQAVRIAGRPQQLNVVAQAVKASGQQVTVEIDKPLGLSLGESTAAGGGLVVKSVSGNAAKSGIKVGDTIIYASSFFGEELWPCDKLSFTNSAIKACPSPVCFVYVRGENTSINVKRLNKKPAPPRFGKKLTEGQKANATHVCVDCGWVYCEALPFESVAATYRCPQCQAPKRRFVEYDVRTEQAKGMAEGTIGTIATVVVGLGGIAVLAWLASTI